MTDTDQPPVYGCTIDGQPAMPILISEHTELVTRAERAEAELRQYTEADSADAAAGSYAGRAEQAEAELAKARQDAANAYGQRDRLRLRIAALADRWQLPGHISMPDAAAEIAEALDREKWAPTPDPITRVREAVASFDGRGVLAPGRNNFDIPTAGEVLDKVRAALDEVPAATDRRRDDDLRALYATLSRIRNIDRVPPQVDPESAQGIFYARGWQDALDRVRTEMTDTPSVDSTDTVCGLCEDEPICGSEPPADVAHQFGDCWCTLPPDHEGDCQCGPCTERHGAPGWKGAPLTPVEGARLAESGVNTPGCDCGHDGMGVSWHGDDCPWRRSVLDGTTAATLGDTACDAYRLPTTQAESGVCGRCGMYDYKHHAAPIPAAPDAEPDTVTDPAWLCQQYAKAIAADDGHPWDTLPADRQESYLDNADAVMRVRDRHIEQLRQRLSLAEHFHQDIATVRERADQLAAELGEVIAQRDSGDLFGPSRETIDRWRAVLDEQPDGHVYLSTGCRHGDHAYCKNMTGMNGAKRPASCKHCGARCICPCHADTKEN